MLGNNNYNVVGSAAHQAATPLDSLGGQLLSLAGCPDPFFVVPSDVRRNSRTSQQIIASDVTPFDQLNFPALKIESGWFQCPLCSIVCKDKGLFRRHYRVHSGEKPFACLLCPYRANQNSTLKSHLFHVHAVRTELSK